MKTIQELIEERNLRKKESKDKKEMSKNFRDSANVVGTIKDDLQTLNENWQSLSEQQKSDLRDSFAEVMDRGVKVTNLSDAKPQIDINLRGMETLDVRSVNILGLGDTVKSLRNLTQELSAGLQQVVKNLNSISGKEINVKMPEIKIPEIKIPDVKMPEVQVTMKEPEKPIKITYEYSDRGDLSGITEKYKTGTVKATKNFNSWEIQDDRRNT